MSDVLVIGGGFAGVWSAAAAARMREEAGGDLSITLIAPGDDLVIRPRLYEANPQAMRVPLERILSPVGVRRVAGVVTGIDAARRTVTAVACDGETMTLDYRRLVLAAGSGVRRPELPGAEHLHNVDTLAGAVALDSHLRRLPGPLHRQQGVPDGPGRFTAVVVGAGFTGLEVATELVGRLRERAAEANGRAERVRVVLVERAAVVGPDLGPGPRPVITAALAELGVEVRLGQTLASVGPTSVRFSDGTELATHTVVWTAGVQATTLSRQVPGQRDHLGRLHVDEHLRIPEAPEVFAAGDTAAAAVEPGHLVMPSCQHAIPLGKHAGRNAAADLLDAAPEAFRPAPYVTCLDLGPAGAVFTTGFERTVQMTGPQAKQRKRITNQQWIYPPLDDPAEILRVADHRVSARRADG